MGIRLLQKIAIDSVIWIAATFLAFLLRLDGLFFVQFDDILLTAAVIAPFKIGFILLFAHQKVSWRHTSVMDLLTPLKSVTVFSIFYLSAAVAFSNPSILPYGIPVIDGLIALVLFATV